MKKVKLGKYEHYKQSLRPDDLKQSLRPDGLKGGLYEVLGECVYSETLEEMVIYIQLHDNNPKYPIGTIWVRPKKMFLENVEMNGKRVPRFKYIEK